MSESNLKLTATEIASLWTAFMNESMSICIVGQMLKYIGDSEINKGVQTAYDLSKKNIETLTIMLKNENFAIPNGFTKEDVNMDAPKIYSDTFCLIYVNHIARVGMLGYSSFVSMSVRNDIRNYFTQGLNNLTSLYNSTIEIALSKGIFVRAPFIGVPTEIDYIDSKKYLSGLNPFTNSRPLNAIEISHLYMNIQTNAIGSKLCLSFAQTSQNSEVQEYMIRGKEIANKHVKLFTSALEESDIVSPGSPNIDVSYSTSQTFSDKLMIFLISLLSAAGIGNYATAAAASQRNDLVLNYERLSLEIAQFAKSGADIMIKNNWLEQPPGLKDREKLVKEKES